MFHEGDILCSKYQLKRQFNKGGFSSVWLAYDLKAKADFALKIYDNIEDMEEFRKGFNLVVNLTHSNIFKPLSYDVHEGVPFLVMSYCKGGSATSKIGKMSEEELWIFAHDVADGLAYLHDEKAIVHQDIKPGNILIDDGGKYMITDFDISTRQRHTVRMTARQVQEMQDFNYGSGTPDYMGPERWPDREDGYRPPVRPLAASDIWSFGATLFELMTGEMPFGETGGAYQRNLCKDLSWHNRGGDAIPKIRGNYSRELKKLVRLCLARDTWRRPTARQISDSAAHHKAPNLKPFPLWTKYVFVCVFVAFVAASVAVAIYRQKEIEGEKRQKYIDSIYSAHVDSAAEIIRKQSELQSSGKIDCFDAAAVANACSIYAKADTMSLVTDSITESGRRLWAESQELIDKEYLRLASEEQKYKNMDATDAALDFANRRYRMEEFVSEGKKIMR